MKQAAAAAATRHAETRQRMQNGGNAKRNGSCEEKSRPFSPPARRVPFNPFFVSPLFFRVPPQSPFRPRRRGASFRDYILEIVNRMPADDAPADIPYISGDPFFERISKTREEWKTRGDDLKTLREERPRKIQSDKSQLTREKRGEKNI